MKGLFRLELPLRSAHCFLSLLLSCSKTKRLFSLELLVEGAHCFCVASQWLLLQNEKIIGFGVACWRRSLLQCCNSMVFAPKWKDRWVWSCFLEALTASMLPILCEVRLLGDKGCLHEGCRWNWFFLATKSGSNSTNAEMRMCECYDWIKCFIWELVLLCRLNKVLHLKDWLIAQKTIAQLLVLIVRKLLNLMHWRAAFLNI